MFSLTYSIDEALENILGCDHFFFTDQHAAGIHRLAEKTGLALEPRHSHRSVIAPEFAPAVLGRLRESLEPEYRLIEKLKALQPEKNVVSGSPRFTMAGAGTPCGSMPEVEGGL
jgi:hypothetical protein